MKKLRILPKTLNLLLGFLWMLLAFVTINAQSTSIEFPTAVTSSEIKGKISARDIGDSRLTTHYYFFNGNQGDIFIKILTSNLDGDIDVFIADTLRPLTKISLFSDTSGETAREIYLRKPEKLILRIEGRTPSDEAATYSIKFEGSFLAVTNKKDSEEPLLPEVKSDPEGVVKVNSVGTIVKKPLKTPLPSKTTVAKTPVKTPVKKTTTPKSVSTVKKETDADAENKEDAEKPKVIVEDSVKTEEKGKEDLPKEADAEKTDKPESKTATTKPRTARTKTSAARKPATASTAKGKATKPPVTAPKLSEKDELAKGLENVKLVVLMKDGTKIEKPMNDVLRFGVDKGTLTIILKDGNITRYSILDVSKMTVE